jgi:hypothetical protein
MATDLQEREYSCPAPVKEIDTFVTHMQSKGLELKLVHDKGSFEFLICNSCFWCASTLGECGIEACPSCKNDVLESFPISKRQYEIDNNSGGKTGPVRDTEDVSVLNAV